jgi:transcriptional regulator with XRE-family HTH domain
LKQKLYISFEYEYLFMLPERKNILLPKHERFLSQMGQQFKLARLRRKLSLEQVSERAGIAKSTLWRIENGDSGVSIGNYFSVLLVLGLEQDVLKLAADDELGRKLQDIGLITKKRAPKRKTND